MTAALWMVLAAVTTAPVKVAVTAVNAVGVDQRLANSLVERFVVLSRTDDLTVVTQQDIVAVLGAERQRLLLGCSSSACMTELADALGADVLLRAEVARAGQSFTMLVKFIRASTGQELASQTVRTTTEDGLQEWIEGNARQLSEQIVLKLRGRPARGGPGWLRWASLGVGGATAAVGGTLFGLGAKTAGDLQSNAAMNAEQIHAAASSGRTLQGAGVGLLVTGAAFAVASAVLFLVYEPGAVLTVAPVGSGGAVFFSVRLP